jgi:hypothetical protein
MSAERCPHCKMDLNFDTDFLYQNGMFEDEATGSFKCMYCDKDIYWKAYFVVQHDFETDPDFL